MWRILLEWPGSAFRLHSFSVLLMAACFGSFFLAAWRARREGLDPEAVYGLAVWLLGGGFVGARAVYIARHPESIHQLADVVKLWQGGIVFYGCIAGGLAGSLYYWARHPFPFRPMADAVAPALALGLGFGRLGCFLNGCCFGGPSTMPWAVSFPTGSPAWSRQALLGLIPASAPRSLPVHPVQLYESLEAFALLGVLTLFYPRRRRDGEVMALLMVTYPILRFTNESLRADEAPVLAGLTLSHWISVGLLAAGIVTWIVLAQWPAGRLADGPATPVPASFEEASHGPLGAPHRPVRPGESARVG